MVDNQNLMCVRGLSVRFPTRSGDTHEAVTGLDLDLSAGSSLGLVGESGSGKTVSALAVLGLLPATAEVEGIVSWQGQRLACERDWQGVRGRGLTMMFQDARASLNPGRTIGAQLGSTLRQWGDERDPTSVRQAAAQLLRAVRLEDVERILGAFPHELSGGMAQRAALALALACRPQLLIVDEPTAALDPTVAVALVSLLKGISRHRGISLLVISHDLNVVKALCDEVLVLAEGRVVERGATADLLSRPQHAKTFALVEAARWRLPDTSEEKWL